MLHHRESAEHWNKRQKTTARQIALLVMPLVLILATYLTWDRREAARLSDVYTKECAVCHGAALEGNPEWRQSLFGNLDHAPPLDGRGRATEQPDRTLIKTIRRGVTPGEGHIGTLKTSRFTEQEAREMLQWIKRHWSKRERRSQSRLTKVLEKGDRKR